MITLAGELGRLLFGVIATEFIRGGLRQSGQSGLTVGGKKHKPIGAAMSYELIGYDEDDDFGSIGAELIGADDMDLLEALSVEGDFDDLISGDGTSEIIGKAVNKAKANAKRAALAKLAMRSAGGVIKRGLDRKRRYPLGFIPTNILAGATSAVPSAPQNLFRPERLVIPSDIAFDLGVRDIKVGNQSQFVQSAEVPAALFSEVAINTGVTFDTAEVGNQVSVDMRNKSAGTIEFSAGLVGSIAK